MVECIYISECLPGAQLTRSNIDHSQGSDKNFGGPGRFGGTFRGLRCLSFHKTLTEQ